jgi:hypothetical protein
MTNEILLEEMMEMSRFLHDQTQNLDVRNGAVFSKAKVNKGTKFGPFIAKFTDKPLDRRFAWEVSQLFPFTSSRLF